MASYSEVVGVSPEGRGVVGWVIGKGGSGIKEMIESTGVRGINYEKGKSQFVVSGTPSRVEAASKILRQKIQECMTRQTEQRERKRNRTTYQSDIPAPSGKRVAIEKTVWGGDVRPGRANPSKNPFDSLNEMEGMSYKDYLAKQQKEKDEREAARAAEEKDLEDAWSGLAKVSLEDTRAESAEKEPKDKEALAERTKVPDGMVVHRREEPEVLGGGGKKTKKSRVRGRKNKGVSVTAEVLPSRTVDFKKLRQHNWEVTQKERAARKAKQEAWEARNKPKAKVVEPEPVVEDETVESVVEDDGELTVFIQIDEVLDNGCVDISRDTGMMTVPVGTDLEEALGDTFETDTGLWRLELYEEYFGSETDCDVLLRCLGWRLDDFDQRSFTASPSPSVEPEGLKTPRDFGEVEYHVENTDDVVISVNREEKRVRFALDDAATVELTQDDLARIAEYFGEMPNACVA